MKTFQQILSSRNPKQSETAPGLPRRGTRCLVLLASFLFRKICLMLRIPLASPSIGAPSQNNVPNIPNSQKNIPNISKTKKEKPKRIVVSFGQRGSRRYIVDSGALLLTSWLKISFLGRRKPPSPKLKSQSLFKRAKYSSRSLVSMPGPTCLTALLQYFF